MGNLSTSPSSKSKSSECTNPSSFSQTRSSDSTKNGIYDEKGYYKIEQNEFDSESPGFKAVYKKLTQANTFNKLGLKSDDEQNELTHSLSNSEAFKNIYLNVNCLEHNRKISKQIEEEMTNLTGYELDSFNSEESSRIFDRVLYHRRNTKQFNVRMFVTKSSISEKSWIRRLANISNFEYGAFHVGLDIDGVILEWGAGMGGNSIIIPTFDVERLLVYARVNFNQIFPASLSQTLSTMAEEIQPQKFNVKKFFVQICSVLMQMVTCIYTFCITSDDKLKKISSKCVFYNTTFEYNFWERNCQEFMKDVLKTLDIKFEPEGEFKKFLERVTMHSNNDFFFRDENFKSRQELDSFADRNWLNLENVWDKRLLMCYSELMDKQYKYNKDEKWGPIDKDKWAMRTFEL